MLYYTYNHFYYFDLLMVFIIVVTYLFNYLLSSYITYINELLIINH